jgi:hypothetical protein
VFGSLIEASPVIPAMRSLGHVDAAIRAPSHVVYLLCGNVTNVLSSIAALKDAGKAAIVNIDLLAGLSGDPSAIDFLRDGGVDGIISTHTDVLRNARNRKLYTIQRSFLLDSAALANAVRALDRFEPDAGSKPFGVRIPTSRLRRADSWRISPRSTRSYDWASAPSRSRTRLFGSPDVSHPLRVTSRGDTVG